MSAPMGALVLALFIAGQDRLGRDKIEAALLEAFEGAIPLKAKKPKNASQLAKEAVNLGAWFVVAVELEKVDGDPPFVAKTKLIDANTGAVALRFEETYGKGGAKKAGVSIAERVKDHLAVRAEPPSPAEPPPPEPEPEPEPAPIAKAPPPPPPPLPVVHDSAPSLGRVRLGGGAGWLRSIDVRDSDSLSYTLGPKALFELGAELVLPNIDLGAAVDLGVRPVRYAIQDGSAEPKDPRGFLFDLLALLLYRADLGSVALLPQLGVRFALASIESHPDDVIPATTTLAVVAGLALRIPLGDLFEIEAGALGGWLPLYDERPTDTGRSKGGFTAGGHLSLRVWLIGGLGLALDNRAGFDRVTFGERPTRPLPPDDTDLENAALGIFEVKSTLAAAYRF
jgi:hypothetical protein